MDSTQVKALVGARAVDQFVKNGMKLGLGTGSTAVWAVRRIGELLKNGELNNIVAVATSSQTEMECQKANIPLRMMNDPEIDGQLDLTIDGADEVDSSLNCTKGGGGALLIEKVVAYASKKFVIVVDESKIVKDLALAFPIPNEVLPLARVPVTRAFEKMGATVQVREAVKKMGAVITDNGNILLDINFKSPIDPKEMETLLSEVPGVLGNGLFTRKQPAAVLVGNVNGEIKELN